MNLKNSFPIFFQLLNRDLRGFWREYPSKLFDTAFLFFTNTVVFAYFMSQETLSKSYGPFILVGSIASFGLIEVVGKVGLLTADIDGTRTISQALILPIPAASVFCYIAIFWAISSALLSVLLFPLGKVLLWSRFDLSAVSYIRLIPMFITANLFYGFFALWLTSLLKGISSLNIIWMRAINPMWMFGAYFYSWNASFELSPIIGYISLINPMVYIMEGMRAAALGQTGYLPYGICLFMVWVFIFLCGLHAVRRLRKRLDCV